MRGGNRVMRKQAGQEWLWGNATKLTVLSRSVLSPGDDVCLPVNRCKEYCLHEVLYKMNF